MRVTPSRRCTIGLLMLLPVSGYLVGCLQATRTPEEFRQRDFGKREFVSRMPLKDAYELVARQTIRCHQGDASQMSMVGGAFFVFSTGSTRVEGSNDEGNGSAAISVKLNLVVDGNLLQVIDFHRIDAKRTRVVAYQSSDSRKWTMAMASVEGWFSGKSDCCEMW